MVDDLEFMAGRMAIDKAGPVPHACAEPTVPWLHDGARAQMEHILDKATRIPSATGIHPYPPCALEDSPTIMNKITAA